MASSAVELTIGENSLIWYFFYTVVRFWARGGRKVMERLPGQGKTTIQETQSLVVCHTLVGPDLQTKQPELDGNCLSLLCFWPVTSLVNLSWARKLTSKDLWQLEEKDRGSYIASDFHRFQPCSTLYPNLSVAGMHRSKLPIPP